MKKKLICAVAASACAMIGGLTLVACGGNEDDGGKEEGHTHTLSAVEAKAADCLEGGNSLYYVCAGCDKIFADAAGTEETNLESVTLKPLDHDWNEGTTVPADCTHDGVTTFRCKRVGCNATNEERTGKLGHDMGKELTQSVHTHYYGCSRCDYREGEEDHVYTDADDSVCRECGNITYDTAFVFSGLKNDGTAASTEAESVSYSVGAYTGNRKRVMIPLTYNGKPVTRINAETFKENTTITAVSIPRTVVLIGKEAFFGCTSLIDVELQGGVTEVGYGAFQNCTSLRHVTFSGKISKLGQHAFQGSGIRSIHFPDSLTTIQDNAFAQCENLTEITIPSTVTSVGKNIFLYCSALETVNFMASVDKVDDMMFNYSSALKNVKLSSTIKKLGMYSFAKTSIVNVDFLPEGLTTIGNKAFTGCKKIKSVKIPSTCTDIQPDAFRTNEALETVTGGGKVEEIGMFAFYGCCMLERVEGMQNLTSIGESAFYNCNKLTSFEFGSKLETIEQNAFRLAAITSVRLGDSVTTLGDYAFANNGALSEVTIGGGLESVGNYVFYNCAKLVSASCGSKIGYGMFRLCGALKTVTIGAGVSEIAAYAFYECAGLQSVVFEGGAGWKAEATGADGTTQSETPAVSSSGAANADLLNNTYVGYVWTRNQ